MSMYPRSADEQTLEILDRFHGDGMSAREVSAALGVSRGSVIGKVSRIKADEVDECTCQKPENRNGGMPRGWWRT